MIKIAEILDSIDIELQTLREHNTALANNHDFLLNRVNSIYEAVKSVCEARLKEIKELEAMDKKVRYLKYCIIFLGLCITFNLISLFYLGFKMF